MRYLLVVAAVLAPTGKQAAAPVPAEKQPWLDGWARRISVRIPASEKKRPGIGGNIALARFD